jgi:hypothetical protein
MRSRLTQRRPPAPRLPDQSPHAPADDDGPIVLLAAIVLQAIKGAAHGAAAARAWLHGGDCDRLLESHEP